MPGIQHAQSLLGAGDAFLHPFDDPLLWQGHASMIDEMARSGPKPDAVVLSVGGGGLLCGVVEGLHRNGWQDIAVETEGTASLQAGHPVELAAVRGVATSLGARRVCVQALTWAQSHPIHSLQVSDPAALGACEQFLSDHRVLIKPACGAARSVVYDGPLSCNRIRKLPSSSVAAPPPRSSRSGSEPQPVSR